MDLLGGLLKLLGSAIPGGGAVKNMMLDSGPMAKQPSKSAQLLQQLASMASIGQPMQYIDPKTHQPMPLGQAPAGFTPYQPEVPTGQDPKNYGYPPEITYNPNMNTNIPYSTHYPNPQWNSSRGGAPNPNQFEDSAQVWGPHGPSRLSSINPGEPWMNMGQGQYRNPFH